MKRTGKLKFFMSLKSWPKSCLLITLHLTNKLNYYFSLYPPPLQTKKCWVILIYVCYPCVWQSRHFSCPLVYFVWICRNIRCIIWFHWLLQSYGIESFNLFVAVLIPNMVVILVTVYLRVKDTVLSQCLFYKTANTLTILCTYICMQQCNLVRCLILEKQSLVTLLIFYALFLCLEHSWNLQVLTIMFL